MFFTPLKKLLPVSVFVLLIVLCQSVFADPLLLSSAEMQKLQKYFPANEGGHLSWK